MPLDDIFYEKEEQLIITEAKRCENRWRKTSYITSILGWIGFNTLSYLDEGIDLDIVIYSLSQLPLIVIIGASILSNIFTFISYKKFSREERTGIYFYIIITFAGLILGLISLYGIFYMI